MAKKIDTAKSSSAATASKAPAPVKNGALPTVVKSSQPAVATAKTAVTPPGKAKPKNNSSEAADHKKAPAPAVSISNDDIALRAYFIAEDRRRRAIHGDEQGDWIEAERQLRNEQTKSPTMTSAPRQRKSRAKKAVEL